jgi:hypothetical protein
VSWMASFVVGCTWPKSATLFIHCPLTSMSMTPEIIWPRTMCVLSILRVSDWQASDVYNLAEKGNSLLDVRSHLISMSHLGRTFSTSLCSAFEREDSFTFVGWKSGSSSSSTSHSFQYERLRNEVELIHDQRMKKSFGAQRSRTHETTDFPLSVVFPFSACLPFPGCRSGNWQCELLLPREISLSLGPWSPISKWSGGFECPINLVFNTNG